MIKNLGSAMIEKGLVPENDDYGLKVSSGEHVRRSRDFSQLGSSRRHLLPHALRVDPRGVQLLLHEQRGRNALRFPRSRILRVCRLSPLHPA